MKLIRRQSQDPQPTCYSTGQHAEQMFLCSASFLCLIVFVRFSSSQARFILAELVRRHSVGHIMLGLILSVYILICAAPVTHPLSHASSQDGARVWYSAHFCYVHTVHQGGSLRWRQSDRCVLHVSICKPYLWQLHLLTGETA